MSREKEAFRDVMAQLNDYYPEKGMLTPAEAARFLGVSHDTMLRLRKAGKIRFNAATGRIAKADLARQVCS